MTRCDAPGNQNKRTHIDREMQAERTNAWNREVVGGQEEAFWVHLVENPSIVWAEDCVIRPWASNLFHYPLLGPYPDNNKRRKLSIQPTLTSPIHGFRKLSEEKKKSTTVGICPTHSFAKSSNRSTTSTDVQLMVD